MRPRLAGCLFLAAAALAASVLAAGAQAPPGAASLDQILKEIASYDGGIESAPFWKLRDYVQARKDDAAGRAECETKLLQFLKTPATPAAKMAATRHLRVVAGESAVPALQALLRNDATADYALYVLQPMPGSAADKALVQALATTTGSTRLGVVSAVGRRRSADAVPVLVPMLQQPGLAVPAATALGAIGGDAASRALLGALPQAKGELKGVVAGALLESAERALAAKDATGALHLYEALSTDAGLPPAARKGAALGRIAASGSASPTLLMSLLTGNDHLLQEAAVAKIKDVVAPREIAPVCAALPRLPENIQVQVLAVLAGYPREAVLQTVMSAARGSSLPVRLAGLRALETVGDASVVSFVAETAARSRGAEQAAARNTLGMLKGRAVDEAILAQLSAGGADEVRGELLLAVGDRRIFSAKAAVSAALASPSPRLRSQALKALRAIGTPSDVPGVLDLLVKSADGPEQSEAEATAASLAQKTQRADARAALIKTRLKEEKDPRARARLMALLPLIGDNSALPLLRAARNDENADVADAAIRALTAWPTTAARDDVLRLARDSRNETHRLLAIVALVRMVGLDRNRDPEAAVADLRSAAAYSWRPEEQRLVLGALVQFPCGEALELASGYLREATVRQEAEAAVEKIKARMK